MQVSLEEIRNIKIIHIEGTIDMYSAKELKEFLLSLTSPQSNKFILNINNVGHIDSSGIAAIINFNLVLQKNSTRLRILMKKTQLHFLHYFQLDKSMSFHYSLEDALDSFL